MQPYLQKNIAWVFEFWRLPFMLRKQMLAKNGLLKVKEISEFLNNETLFTSLSKAKIQIKSYFQS